MCILRISGVIFRVVWPITSSGGWGPKFAVDCESCVKVRNENYRGSVALRTHCRIMYILLQAEPRRVTVQRTAIGCGDRLELIRSSHANTVRTQLFRVGAPDLRAGRSDARREPAARRLQSMPGQGTWTGPGRHRARSRGHALRKPVAGRFKPDRDGLCGAPVREFRAAAW